jgi:hypothetical protein
MGSKYLEYISSIRIMNAQDTIYIFKKTLKGENCIKPEGLSELSPLISDGSWDIQTGGWTS